MLSVKGVENPFSTLILVILVILCFLFGGSPNVPGFAFTSIVLIALVMIVLAVNNGAIHAFARLGFFSKLSFSLIFLVPLIQLVPLPPSIWQSFPGRELSNETRSIIGHSQNWYPISLDQLNTAFTFFSLFPGAAAFLGWLILRGEERKLVIFSIVLIACLSIIIGLTQFASGGAYLDIFDNSHRGYFQGFFANRNHAALMLCYVFVISLFLSRIVHLHQREKQLLVRFIAATLVFLCGLAILTTFSRAGLGLLVLALAMVLLSDQIVRLRGRRMYFGILLLAPLSFLVLLQSGIVSRLFGRFDTIPEDDRFEFWRTTLEIAIDYFPIGSGLGTFQPIFAKYEKLSDLRPTYVNHAHQDYLELLLETGALGILILVTILVAVTAAAISLWRSRSKNTAPYPYIGGIVVVLTLFHNLVDYPLRTQSIAVMFGLAAAMLAEAGKSSSKTMPLKRP
jgi:O-antigen ligase